MRRSSRTTGRVGACSPLRDMRLGGGRLNLAGVRPHGHIAMFRVCRGLWHAFIIVQPLAVSVMPAVTLGRVALAYVLALGVVSCCSFVPRCSWACILWSVLCGNDFGGDPHCVALDPPLAVQTYW